MKTGSYLRTDSKIAEKVPGTLSCGLAHTADLVGIWMPFSSCMLIYRNPVKRSLP